MPDGLDVVYTATEKQCEFLQAPENEVLYGGAAGGGKSFGLILDACGVWQGALQNKNYRALILKRSFPEVAYLIEKSADLVPRVAPGSRWRDKPYPHWVTPAGAKVRFGYCARLSDVYQYQGDEFGYIGVDELTQWPLAKQWKYLASRLRSPDQSITALMRATCNPGGVGHKWVQDRWGIKADGSPSRRMLTIKGRPWWLRFIPAKLEDNPHLLETDYELRLELLDEMERKALRSGRWDIIDVPGSIYPNEVTAMYEEERITRVPIDPTLPVHTVWDLGMSDNMFIILFQKTPMNCRIVDCYTNSGYGMSHYIQILQERAQKGRFVYGEHIGPHDLSVRELGTGESRIDTARRLGLDIRVWYKDRTGAAVRTPPGLEDGIDIARSFFTKCYMDEVKCEPLITSLANYRRDFNQVLGEFKAAPVHDKASHGADCFRYLAVGYPDVSNELSGYTAELVYPRLNNA